MILIRSFILFILLGSPALAAERSVLMMGTILDLEVKSPARSSIRGSKEESVIESMIDEVHKVEQCISTWIPKSDLSKLNASDPGKEILPSQALSSFLLQVRTRAEKFKPFFSPYLGPLVRAWGLRSGGRTPTREELDQALQDSNENSFQFLPSGKIVRTLPGAAIEEGGFGKGLALDRAIARVVERREGGARSFRPEVQIRLNFGGQVLVSGDSLFPIRVSNPVSREEALLEFSIKQGSVSTSGNGEHGMKVGHLLDPRTGLPAPFLGSVTAIAETGLDAELLSKVFVLGKEDGMKWANLRKKEILWILPSSQSGLFNAYPSCSWNRDLKVISKNVTIVREPCAPEKKGEPT